MLVLSHVDGLLTIRDRYLQKLAVMLENPNLANLLVFAWQPVCLYVGCQ